MYMYKTVALLHLEDKHLQCAVHTCTVLQYLVHTQNEYNYAVLVSVHCN